jgi:hypothetical protein
MLQPDVRRSLVDSLRPEPGSTLDLAVGTTYSLNLTALLLVPAAYALFDRHALSGQPDADSGERPTPLGLISALHRTAGRIMLFCDAAQIAPPLHRQRRLLGLVEQAVVPAVAPKGGAFHPKVWAIRFVGSDGEPRYRLLVASRNLTFDRCWDTVTVLESDLDGSTLPGLGDFLRGLPDTAAAPMSEEGRKRVTALAEELDTVRFVAPDGFTELRLHAFGLGDASRPFPKACERLLVVSPFLSAETLAALPTASATSALVSRAEALAASASVASRYQCFTLNSAVVDDAPVDAQATRDDPGRAYGGLHAKLYAADEGGGTTWWTGSANATSAAFSHNVEVLLEMRTTLQRLSVREILRDRADGDPAARRFRDLFVPYPVDQDVADADDSRDDLDDLRRRLAVVGFTATVIERDPGSYEVSYCSDGPLDLPDEVELRCWPATVARQDAPVTLAEAGTLEYAAIATITTLTAFLVLELSDGDERTAFVVRCQLVDPPLNRQQRLIAELIGDANRLLRYLLALLVDDDTPAVIEEAERMEAPQWAFGGLETVPLQEVMVKALARDPRRLRDVAELIETVRDSGSPMPQGLEDLWQAVWQIAEEDRL